MSMKLDPDAAPLSTALSVLGMPGMTAWWGLMKIGKPKAGETVVVSAASGAVGSVVGQLAKLHGCRAVGIAGGKDKCDYVVKELGFDACVDYRAAGANLFKELRAAAPKGIDVYFENVGGAVQAAVLPQLNDFARVPLCGLISQYNAIRCQPRPRLAPAAGQARHRDGLHRVRPFRPDGRFWKEVPAAVKAGKIKYREDIVKGIEKRRKPSWACSRARTSASSWCRSRRIRRDPSRDRALERPARVIFCPSSQARSPRAGERGRGFTRTMSRLTVTVITRWRCWFLTSTMMPRFSREGSLSRPMEAASSAASRSAASKSSKSVPSWSGTNRLFSRISK